jgi:hypothetical protein
MRFSRSSAVWPCLLLGVVSLGLAALLFVAKRNLFDPAAFGAKAEQSLSNPDVAAASGEFVTQAVIKSRPDLIAVRPLILAGANALVETRGFQALAGRAAQRVHQAVFSEGARRILLSLPDLQILLHSALEQASPQLAAKIPKQLEAAAASFGGGRRVELILDGVRFGRRIGSLWLLLFPVGVALLTLSVWLARNRRRILARVGIGLTAAGILLIAIVPAARLAIGLAVHDALVRGLLRGLVSTYLAELRDWGFFFAGLGVLFTAGATSLLEEVDPLLRLKTIGNFLIHPPAKPAGRLGWSLSLLASGLICVLRPYEVTAGLVVLAGIGGAFLAVREIFRLFLQYLAPRPKEAEAETDVSLGPAAAIVASVVVVLASAWIFWRNPAAAAPVRGAAAVCNGHASLCDKRLDEVVFAGAHNAMSNQDVPEWLFPHHEAGIPRQLEDGVRALLFDVHYGFPGGVRVKTDLEKEPLTDKVREAVGAEGLKAAMRIRDRLVGVDEGRRKLFLCHGLCELGAYELEPLLAEIREFVIAHPDDVLLLVVEDYVSPQDLAGAFESSGLAQFVYRGAPEPQWPALRQLIAGGARVVVFIESGREGVPWLRPAFRNLRETPYSFKAPEAFSCAPNRGGDAGSLFLLNHWIETTPTPKPSNAAVVNSYASLMQRALKCRDERQHVPNIVAVDFYRTGDLFRVVNELNGVSSNPPPAK